MTTFKVGDTVTFHMIYSGTFKVLEIKDVPAEDIEFNPATGEGGVGHHQWLLIDSKEHSGLISGLFFEEKQK